MATYSCIQGIGTLAGEGNIGDDPLLAGNGIHLRAGSPCIDAGSPLGKFDGQVDIDGEPREVGQFVDIGVDEFLDTDEDSLPDWWEQSHFGSPTAGTPSADPDNDGRENLAEYGGDTNPFVSPQIYHVDLAGDDGWDGLTPAWDGEHGPKSTIRAGIAVADPREGDVVIVAPGTYTGDGNRDLDFLGKAMTVRSMNPDDPEVVAATVIDCEGTDAVPHRAFRFQSLEGPDSVVAGFTITGGYAIAGGAVSCSFASPTLTNCRIVGNSAGNSGGGIYNASTSRPALVHCTFIGNSAGVRGGGMCNSGSSPTVTGCTFSGNSAGISGGGGVCNSGSSPTFTNCSFNGNSAGSGGGMRNGGGSPTLVSCAFVGNSGNFNGGGMSNTGSSPTLTNCILWSNSDTGGMGESAQILGPSPIVTYSCIQGLDALAGDGNIGDDPVFMRSPDLGLDGVWGTEDDDYGDLRLTAGSPAIDGGDPSVSLQPGETDLDGHARVLCGRVDMGAYEFGIGDFDCDSSVDLDDYALWAECLTGVDGGPYADGCEAFDFDFDLHVDLIDFAAFQVLLE